MLMYIRTFQPKDTSRDHRWFLRNVLHIVAFLAAILLGMRLVLGAVRGMEATGVNLGTLTHFAHGYIAELIGAAVSLWLLRWLARPRGEVGFNESNAIDVEMMGLYWHFVDIVWIVIFTVVYLLEYI
jgi:cytochrome o ubiquinol oxidase subunit 3